VGLKRIETGRAYERKVRHGAGTVVEGRLFYSSGMTSRDAEGNLIGKGDMAAQVAQAYKNVGDALRAAGTDFEHVVKYTIYVTDIDAYMAVTGTVAAPYNAHRQSSTLVQVVRLAHPDMLVEVEAIAVVEQ
jgi:enamine deaminase RidA (YjgF/YER057c/UK114 family)